MTEERRSTEASSYMVRSQPRSSQPQSQSQTQTQQPPLTPTGPKSKTTSSVSGFLNPDDFYSEVVEIPSNVWIFDIPDVLHTTPSRFQGVELQQEVILKQKAVLMIHRLFFELRLSHRTLYYAWTYVHRFYMRGSLKVFGQYELAAAAIFLACKCTENHRGYKELIPAVVKDTTKGKITNCKETSKEFWKWRDIVEIFECHLLELLCFDLIIETPYEFTQWFARTETIKNYAKDDRGKFEKLMSNITVYIEDCAMVGVGLCFNVRQICHTAVAYIAFEQSIPSLLKEIQPLSSNNEAIAKVHDCFEKFVHLLPPEYAKKYTNRYTKMLLKQEFNEFCK